jgi:hypothetical protein
VFRYVNGPHITVAPTTIDVGGVRHAGLAVLGRF